MGPFAVPDGHNAPRLIDELVPVVGGIGERYRSGDRRSKGRVLDEFVAVTGFHRKHAMRLLRTNRSAKTEGPRLERRIYDEAVRTALVVLWEASDRLCGKRLRPLIPILLEAMERHGHLDVAADVETKLTRMSAATIDRALRGAKAGDRAPRRRGVAGTALTVRDYCASSGVAFTRCRPYHKNDQAWVEQKNGSVVRRLVGYRRFEGLEATAALADLYSAARLFVNFFQPSFKLAEKHRDGDRVPMSRPPNAGRHRVTLSTVWESQM